MAFGQLLDRFHRGSRESRCTTRTSAGRRSSWTWTLSLQATSSSSSRWERVRNSRISPQPFSLQVKGIPAKISDFGLRGMLRVVFKPLVSSCLKKFSAICSSPGQPDTVGRWSSSLLPEGFLKSQLCSVLNKELNPGSWNWLRAWWRWWCSQPPWSSQDCWANHHRTGLDSTWFSQVNLAILTGEELHRSA